MIRNIKKCILTVVLLAAVVFSSIQFVGAEEAADFQTGEILESNNIISRASVYPYSWMNLEMSEPADFTFSMPDTVYSQGARITVAGTCSAPGTKLYFRLYEWTANGWVLIGASSAIKSDSRTGYFEWNGNYGGNGTYAVKAWASYPCTISGSYVY